jgi:hypothetical protein
LLQIAVYLQPQRGAVVQLVRMPACHAGGHGSESRSHRKLGFEVFPRSFFRFRLLNLTQALFNLNFLNGIAQAARQGIVTVNARDNAQYKLQLKYSLF